MSDVHARVSRLAAGLERRRPRRPAQPLRRHPLMRWLRSPLLGGPAAKRRGAPSPFEQGLEDGRREGHEQGRAEGLAEGLQQGYQSGFRDGAASAGDGEG